LQLFTAQENVLSPATEEKFHITKDLSIQVRGETITYETVCGSLPVTGKSEKTTASMFFTAYFKKDSSQKTRPIAFCFNGGPGSSSLWLHIGGIGPKMMNLDQLVPKNSLVGCIDNPLSLLAVADLVFIDPISTGFSKATDKEKESEFFNIEDDLYSFAHFIRLFLSKFERWHSPKLLIGESYGTFRAACLVNMLKEQFFIDIDGLALISCVLNTIDLTQDPSNDLSYATALPTYAAIAQYHTKTEHPKDVTQLINEASTFALEEYLPALAQGDSISKERKQEIAKKLAKLTFLPESVFISTNLRLSLERFSEELLKDQGEVFGRFDGRIVRSVTPDETGRLCSPCNQDPSEALFTASFASALQKYFLCDLNLKKEDPYFVFNYKANASWNWQAAGTTFLGPRLLRSALSSNPHLKIFVAAGYYDLATPFLSQKFTITHLLLNEKQQKNITFKGYEAGHMMYLSPACKKPFSDDLSNFVRSLQPS
jgi:carboxypeptidase C (cathepsin A)